MNRITGLLALYMTGLTPSSTPACGDARAVPDGVAEDVTADSVDDTRDDTEVAILTSLYCRNTQTLFVGNPGGGNGGLASLKNRGRRGWQSGCARRYPAAGFNIRPGTGVPG